MVGEACLPCNAYYPRMPDYTLCSGVHVCWSEHSDSSFVYGFMILDYGFGTMTATTYKRIGYSLDNMRQTACLVIKIVREKSRECHSHKLKPFPDPKRKRKPTNLNKHKPNKRKKSTKISSLFPKRGNRNTKRTEKHKNKMTHMERHTTNRLVE